MWQKCSGLWWLLTPPLPGAGGGGVRSLSQRLLPAHSWSGSGGSPFRPAARCHGWPGHGTPSAGALRPPTLPADSCLPEGHPPLFTHSPDTGEGGGMSLRLWMKCLFCGFTCSVRLRWAAGIWRAARSLPCWTGCCTSTTGETPDRWGRLQKPGFYSPSDSKSRRKPQLSAFEQKSMELTEY